MINKGAKDNTMLCKRCNTLLAAGAHFCSNCGLTIAEAAEQQGKTFAPAALRKKPIAPLPTSYYPKKERNQPITPMPPQVTEQILPEKVRQAADSLDEIEQFAGTDITIDLNPHKIAQASANYHQNRVKTKPVVTPMSPFPPTPPLSYFRLDTSKKVTHMLPATIEPRPKRRRGLGCLLTLLILVIVLGAGWFLALRPYLHNMAEQEINNAMSSAINQIPPLISQAPIKTLNIGENVINNVIVLNSSPSSPVQNAVVHVTAHNVELDFQLYGQPCSITQVLKVENGKLMATDVGVNGVLGLIMSPDEMASILNKNYDQAQQHIQRTVQQVSLKEHEIDLTLSPANS